MPIGQPRITQNGICTNIHQDNLNFVLESNYENYKKLKEIQLTRATEEMSLDYKYVYSEFHLLDFVALTCCGTKS